ncbi:MAG: DUF58 domain-containing protein [Planctomycetota bacterium]|jgi:uncharacterized protein (DUF58 family)|nr:DUF58 domain-containing protein [Planctomycetota bacterium]MDP7131931.1 DUF58 domain-containing protein [Planctomycetota bacterium]
MDNQPRQSLRYLDPATLQKIGSLELVAREVVEGVRVGMHKSPLRGLSTEFSQHRPYVPGDGIRNIDWRVYGRTSRYYIKLFEAETNFTANLLLDASSSMSYSSGEISKLEYAKYMAASLAYLIVKQRDQVGLGVFDSDLRHYIEPKSTMGVIRTIAESLEDVDHEPKTNVYTILDEFARRMSRRGFVILFSDLFDDLDGFIKGLNHLRFRGHNVVVFHVLDPYELTFPFDGVFKFNGLELDGDIVTQPKRIRAAYLRELEKFLESARRACEKAHVDYVLVDTSKPIETALVSFLVGRVQRAVK